MDVNIDEIREILQHVENGISRGDEYNDLSNAAMLLQGIIDKEDAVEVSAPAGSRRILASLRETARMEDAASLMMQYGIDGYREVFVDIAGTEHLIGQAVRTVDVKRWCFMPSSGEADTFFGTMDEILKHVEATATAQIYEDNRDNSWREVAAFLQANGWKPLPSGHWTPNNDRSMQSAEVNANIAELGWQVDICQRLDFDFAYMPRYMHEPDCR